MVREPGLLPDVPPRPQSPPTMVEGWRALTPATPYSPEVSAVLGCRNGSAETQDAAVARIRRIGAQRSRVQPEDIAEVLSSMRAFRGQPVQLAGVEALWGLAANRGQLQKDDPYTCRPQIRDENKVLIGQMGGIEQLLAGMQACFPNTGAMVAGLNCVEALASHDGLKRHITQVGGVEVCLEAMRAQYGCVQVAEHGCRCVSMLATNDANKELVARLGGVDVVLAAIQAHPQDEVLRAGKAALSILGTSPAIREQIVRAGGAKYLPT